MTTLDAVVVGGGAAGIAAAWTLAIIPTLAVSALLIAVPTALSLLLVARFGEETIGRDPRDLDPDGHVFDRSGYHRRPRVREATPG